MKSQLRKESVSWQLL